MMTEAQRRYMKARDRVVATLLDPTRELMEATREMIAEANQRAKDAEDVLAQLRPLWAQGYTSDSEAAQATGNALTQIWQALGVDNQTAAMERLRALVHLDEAGVLRDDA